MIMSRYWLDSHRPDVMEKSQTAEWNIHLFMIIYIILYMYMYINCIGLSRLLERAQYSLNLVQ